VGGHPYNLKHLSVVNRVPKQKYIPNNRGFSLKIYWAADRGKRNITDDSQHLIFYLNTTSRYFLSQPYNFDTQKASSTPLITFSCRRTIAKSVLIPFITKSRSTVGAVSVEPFPSLFELWATWLDLDADHNFRLSTAVTLGTYGYFHRPLHLSILWLISPYQD